MLYKATLHSISECLNKEWKRSIWTSAKSPQNYLVAIATSLGILRTYVSFIIFIHTSTKAKHLVKISPKVAEILQQIFRFLLHRLKSYNFSYRNLRRYWTKVHQICTRCREIIYLYCDIPICVEMPGCWMKVDSPILLKIDCHGNVRWRIGKTGLYYW